MYRILCAVVANASDAENNFQKEDPLKMFAGVKVPEWVTPIDFELLYNIIYKINGDSYKDLNIIVADDNTGAVLIAVRSHVTITLSELEEENYKTIAESWCKSRSNTVGATDLNEYMKMLPQLTDLAKLAVKEHASLLFWADGYGKKPVELYRFHYFIPKP